VGHADTVGLHRMTLSIVEVAHVGVVKVRDLRLPAHRAMLRLRCSACHGGMRRMGQGEREFTRRGEIHETRSKASNTARTGSTGRRRDQLSRFTRGDHARLASGGHRGQPSPSLGGKIWRAKAAPRGAGRGGRSLGRRRRVDARLGRNTPHVALDSTARDHPVREERARVSGERSHNPYCDLARETNRLIDPRRLRAIGIHRGYPPVPSQLKKTHNQPAKSRLVLHDWFDPRCRRSAVARGIPTDEAECSEAGHPQGICAIPERVGPETCRRSRR